MRDYAFYAATVIVTLGTLAYIAWALGQTW